MIYTNYLLYICIITTMLSAHEHENYNAIKNLGFVTGTITIATIGYNYSMQSSPKTIPIYQLDQHNIKFPHDFLWGIGTASTQSEESSNNNSWTTSYMNAHNKINIAVPEYACKSWNLWEDDIEKITYLGLNSYRLSIEWSRVQPSKNEFDLDAINHYVQLCKKLKDRNIAPMICLHHYSDPLWFLEQGGFECSNNIKVFTQFCTKMYEALRPYVSHWIVISQPVAYALKGYNQAIQPPFINDANKADIVMLNMFIAHMNVYDIIHKNYNETGLGLKPEIGLCHQITQMQSHTQYNPIEYIVAHFADRLYNQSLFRFFKTGHFRTLIPLIDRAYYSKSFLKYDFFALSYYSPKSFFGWKPTTPHTTPSHQTADITRIIDASGMYNAIVQASQLGKPIYVVESGVDPVDEQQRILLLNSYLSAVLKAIYDGYDVRGYYYWTLMDNYEWSKPYNSSHFGLYKNRVINQEGDLDPDFKNHEKMLKDGGRYYKSIIAHQKIL